MNRVLTCLLLVLLASFATAQTVRVEAELPTQVTQGDTVRASFRLQLLEAPAGFDEGVWFLNVVDPLEGGETRQMAHLLFSAGREEGKLFRQVFSRSELEAGLSTTLEMELRRFAPPGIILLPCNCSTDGSPTRAG